jgi:hypothetical protein
MACLVLTGDPVPGATTHKGCRNVPKWIDVLSVAVSNIAACRVRRQALTADRISSQASGRHHRVISECYWQQWDGHWAALGPSGLSGMDGA